MSVQFRYRMIDRVTGKSVLENEASLVCEDKPKTAAATGTPDRAGLQRRVGSGLWYWEVKTTAGIEEGRAEQWRIDEADLDVRQRRIDEGRAELAETDRLISTLERPGHRPDSTTLARRESSSSGLPVGVFITGAALTFAGLLTTFEVGMATGPGPGAPAGASWAPTEVAGVATAGVGVTTAVIGIFFTRWRRPPVTPSVASLPGGGAFSLVGTF
jgi:hypothetical protein